MKNYPDLSHLGRADHLLFDLGYSAALLWRAKHLLEELILCGDYPVYPREVDVLVQQIAEFEAGRLKLRGEIYDNAEQAAKKGAAS